MIWTWKRLAITAAFAVLALVAGIWFGEDLGQPIATATFPAALIGALAAYLAAPWRAIAGRCATAMAVLLLLAGGWLFGRQMATTTFNDCVERGQAVRATLADYHAQTGAYPETLDQLRNNKFPGGRWLRPSLLIYRPTATGYELSFSDWLVTHRATETEAFAADK